MSGNKTFKRICKILNKKFGGKGRFDKNCRENIDDKEVHFLISSEKRNNFIYYLLFIFY